MPLQNKYTKIGLVKYAQIIKNISCVIITSYNFTHTSFSLSLSLNNDRDNDALFNVCIITECCCIIKQYKGELKVFMKKETIIYSSNLHCFL